MVNKGELCDEFSRQYSKNTGRQWYMNDSGQKWLIRVDSILK